MNLEGDLPKQARTSNSLKLPVIVVAILIIAILTGIAGYLLRRTHTPMASSGLRPSTPTSTIMSPTPTTSQSLPVTTTTATVSIQDGYFFTVNVPSKYTLVTQGDYIRYIEDAEGNQLIGFSALFSGGERSPQGEIVLNGVSFEIDYRRDIGCPVVMYPSYIKLGTPKHLWFEIYTWCKDEREIQDSIYQQIIKSITFSPDLRSVLRGYKSPPILRH